MAIDTPARIAIIGAGPIGIEATLYARFLGYDVDLYERGRVAEYVRQWGHVRLFTPWGMMVSPLGIAALRGQESEWQPAADDALLTGRELVERYWRPLAESDLVVDSLREQTEVLTIGRPHLLKHELVDDPARGDEDFVISTRDAAGVERIHTADVVIDCSGVFGRHRWAGQGGVPAIGELAQSMRIEYGLIDAADPDQRHRYAGHRVLLIGAGQSAAANALALAGLDPRPIVTWVTRRDPLGSSTGPIEPIADDSLPERQRVSQAANALTTDPGSGITHWHGTSLAAVARDEARQLFACELIGDHVGTIEVDQIVASVGYRPEHRIYEELQVRPNPATGGLPRLGESLLTGEPNFYVLGAKSHGRNSRFLVRDGLKQIRELFAIIGDRAELDLYKTIRA